MLQPSTTRSLTLNPPEVPLGLTPPPAIDIANYRRRLHATVAKYASAGYPMLESPDEPMPIEQSIEQLIGKDQHEILRWQRTTTEQIDPAVVAAEAKTETLDKEAQRIHQGLERVRTEKITFDIEPGRDRRFDRAIGVGPVFGIVLLVGLETWLLRVQIGRLFDWAPREAWAGTFASLGLQEVIFAAAGVAIAVWHGTHATPRERAIRAVFATVGVLASVATATGLMFIRIDAATGSGGWGGAGLFCGLQFGLLVLSMMLGFHDGNPHAAEARRLFKEMDLLQVEHTGTDEERARMATIADELKSYPIATVTAEYQNSVRSAALHLIHEFRSELVVALLAKKNYDSVSRIEELPEPAFVIPTIDDDLSEDDLLGGSVTLPL